MDKKKADKILTIVLWVLIVVNAATDSSLMLW